MNLPAVVIGTTEGAFRVEGSSVTPLGQGSASVTALLELPEGEILAGTSSGQVFRSRDQGGLWQAARGLTGTTAVVSLLRLPGPPSLVVAATACGKLWLSEDGSGFDAASAAGIPPPTISRPTRLVSLPGRPAEYIAAVPGKGLWRARARERAVHVSSSAPLDVVDVAPHPQEWDLWIALTAKQVWRSQAEGVGFTTVPTAPALREPRGAFWEPVPPHRLFLLDGAPGPPRSGAEPSPVWISRDGGQTLESVQSKVLEAPRDPSGEVSALAFDAATGWLAYGTSRGELIFHHLARQQTEVAASGLAPIQVMLLSRARSSIDPATSGIYVLP